MPKFLFYGFCIDKTKAPKLTSISLIDIKLREIHVISTASDTIVVSVLQPSSVTKPGCPILVLNQQLFWITRYLQASALGH